MSKHALCVLCGALVVEGRMWFHDLLLLATICGGHHSNRRKHHPAGMTMALAYQHMLQQYRSRVASGLGTSQDD